MSYLIFNEHFFIINSKDCNAGFNFAFTAEARKFVKAVNNVLNEQRQKSNISLASLPISINLPVEKLAEKSQEKFSLFNKLTGGGGGKEKKKIKTFEIGGPINFSHVAHVGITNSFDVRLNIIDLNNMFTSNEPTRVFVIYTEQIINSTNFYEIYLDGILNGTVPNIKFNNISSY